MRLARIAGPDGPLPVVADGDDWLVVTDLFTDPLVPTGVRVPQEGAELLAPVEPRVVLGMAHNGGPDDRALPAQGFHKSARSVVGPGDPIVLDPSFGATNAETELCLVVGRACRFVTAEQAPDYVLGWTIGNDVTAVDQLPLDPTWVPAKSGDGFTPIGPWIETDLDPLAASLLAGREGDDPLVSSTSRLAWNPYEALAALSSKLTLGPGDVLLTGAPDTAFPIAPGEVARCEIPGIGVLLNPVQSHPTPLLEET